MNSQAKKTFIISFVFLFFGSSAGSFEWISLSEALNPKQIPLPETLTSRHAVTPSMTFLKNQLYLSWTEPDTHGIQQIYLKKLRADMIWEQIGKSLNRDRSYSSSTPFIGTNGKHLFLTWTEKDNDNIAQVYVKQWNGTDWIMLGGSLNFLKDKEAKSPIVAFSNGIPYVAWNESGEKEWSKLYIKHWDGSSWIPDGQGFGLEPEHITQAPYLLFEGNKGHLVWAESDETRIFQIHYATLEDGKWKKLQSPLNQDVKMQAFNPSIAFLKNDLYLTFQERVPEGGFKIQLRHLTPNGWISENSKLISRGTSSFNPVLASDDETILIAWEEWDSTGIPEVVAQVITRDEEPKMVFPPQGNNPEKRFRLNPVLVTNGQSTYLAWKETTDGDLYQIQIRKFQP